MGYREKEVERIINETVNLLVSDVLHNADGGWGVAAGQPSSAWGTAEIAELLTLVSSSLGVNITKVHLPTILEDANTFLVEHQNGDGGWGIEAGKSDATGTELVMIALEQSGQRKFYPHLQKALLWMTENQNPVDAGWSLRGRETASSVFCTCMGCIALSNLPEILKTPIMEQGILGMAEPFLHNTRNPDGGCGGILNTLSTARATAYAVFTLVTIFGHHSKVQSGISWLKRHQNEDGGWGEVRGGNVEATAATIMALLALETNPNSKYILRGIDYLLACRDPVKGLWSDKRNQDPTTWATCYALKALAAYIIACREAGGLQLTVGKRIKSFLLSPKANVVLGVILLFSVSILILQYFNVIKTTLGSYSDLLNALAATATLLSIIWGLVLFIIKKGWPPH